MGGLAHFIEEEGVPTTSISLIREHSEAIQPPRALWVPFELGRPLGVPNDATFQRRVLVSTLELLEAQQGPVLADYPEDIPGAGEGHTTWACPVNFAADDGDLSETAELRKAFADEVAQLRSWYDLAVKERGRTTVGTCGLEPEALAEFLAAFLDDGVPESPQPDMPVGLALKLAVEDLKAYYFESVTAQPGGGAPDAETLADWFWGETKGGAMLSAVKQACAEKDDGMLTAVGTMMIVPMAQAMKGR